MANSAPLPDGSPGDTIPAGGPYGGGPGGRAGRGWRQDLPPEARAAFQRARRIRLVGTVLGFLGLLLLFGWFFYRVTSAPGSSGVSESDYVWLPLVALGVIIVGFILRWTGRGMAYHERQQLRAMGGGAGAGGGWGGGRWAGGPGQGRPGRRACTQCGRWVGPRAAFCPACGHSMEPGGAPPPFSPPSN